MKHILSAKMWSFELHELWMNVPSLVRIVVTGAVLVEKVGVGTVDCVHRNRMLAEMACLDLCSQFSGLVSTHSLLVRDC